MSEHVTRSTRATLDIAGLDAEDFSTHARVQLADTPAAQIFNSTEAPARGDHDLNTDDDLSELHESPRAAAVLVPIVPRLDGLQVLLTLRAAHLSAHAGQIAFPGGKVEQDDDGPLETALREAEEEVGLARTHVTPLGYLHSYQTGSGFRILPVVAMVHPAHALKIDPSEVDEAFEVPLDFLMDPANHQRHSTEWNGATRHYYAMPWRNRYIWGATAGILRNLQETLFPL